MPISALNTLLKQSAALLDGGGAGGFEAAIGAYYPVPRKHVRRFAFEEASNSAVVAWEAGCSRDLAVSAHLAKGDGEDGQLKRLLTQKSLLLRGAALA